LARFSEKAYASGACGVSEERKEVWRYISPLVRQLILLHRAFN